MIALKHVRLHPPCRHLAVSAGLHRVYCLPTYSKSMGAAIGSEVHHWVCLPILHVVCCIALVSHLLLHLAASRVACVCGQMLFMSPRYARAPSGSY